VRRFGPGPYVLGLKRLKRDDEFPFSVPAVANIEKLQLNASMTLLAGENGTGKSTILEAIAAAIGFAKEGGELERLGELPAVPRDVLNEQRVPLLAPVLSPTRPRNGYFLRAESSSTLPSSSTAAIGSLLTSPYTATSLSTPSRTASRSWRLPPTGSGRAVSISSTSRSPRYRSAGRSHCSRS
jgi:predicted ATPase